MGWISEAFHSITGKGSNQGYDTQQGAGNTILNAVLGAGAAYLDYALDYRNSRKEATKAYERNIASAQMQNEYNSPVNAMQRLRDAGLNPNLIYGSVNNNAASISSAPVANPPSAKFDLVSAYQNMEQRDAMTQQIKAQTDLIKQQEKTAKLRQQIDDTMYGVEWENAQTRNNLAHLTYQVAKASLPSDINEAQHRNDWNYRWSRNIGEWINALSPFIQSGSQAAASHWSWHRSE